MRTTTLSNDRNNISAYVSKIVLYVVHSSTVLPMVPLALPIVPLTTLTLPIVPLAPLAAGTVQGSMVANGTNGKITKGTTGGTPNVANEIYTDRYPWPMTTSGHYW